MDARHEQAGTTEPAGFTLAFTAAAAVVAVAVRLVPRWLGLDLEGQYLWQLMPVGALGLFAGARLRGPLALAVPLLAMLVSDLLLIPLLASLGQPAFSWLTPVVYASFAVYALLGRTARRVAWPLSLLPACLLGSVQFFVLTNFIAWLGGDGAL